MSNSVPGTGDTKQLNHYLLLRVCTVSWIMGMGTSGREGPGDQSSKQTPVIQWDNRKGVYVRL